MLVFIFLKFNSVPELEIQQLHLVPSELPYRLVCIILVCLYTCVYYPCLLASHHALLSSYILYL